jgi:hypothetical protein
MGHKSVRQLYFIEDEMDAVDLHQITFASAYNRIPTQTQPGFPLLRCRRLDSRVVIAFISEILSTLDAAFARIK